MALQGFWQGLRHVYRQINAFLELFYHLGPAAHGAQGVLHEFLDGPPDGVRLTWTQGRHGPACVAHDRRGTYRIDLARREGDWAAHACSCLGFQEFRRECRHLRAAREALASGDGERLPQRG